MKVIYFHLARIDLAPIPSKVRRNTCVLITHDVELLIIIKPLTVGLRGVQVKDAIAHILELEAPVAGRVLEAILVSSS